MLHSTPRSRIYPTLILGALLSGTVLVSCGAAPDPSEISSSRADSAGESAAVPATAESLDAAGGNAPVTTVSNVPRPTPQLVKTADLDLTVETIATALEEIQTILQQYNGDLLLLQDTTPTTRRTHHNASLQLRVPQAELDATLDRLKRLGTLQAQRMTAEDVTDQLVDFQARLRNLRKTEETLLEILERSGEVGEVLQVAQELSNVRNMIEQTAAQLDALQNRVAYSTINLTLEEVTATVPPDREVNVQLEETWTSATHSLGAFTTHLLQLGIWLMVYSPYWLILAGLGYGVHRLQRRSRPQPTLPPDPPPSVET